MRLALCLVVIAPAFLQADALPFLPATTDAVLLVESKKVRESELMKKVGSDLLKTALRASKQAATAVDASGIDPLVDVDRVTVAMDLDKANPPKPFALLEGKFDRTKIDASVTAYLKEHPKALEAIDVGGKPAYRVPGGKPEETMFTALLDDGRMVIAPTEKDLQGAFDAAAGARKPVVSKEMATLITTHKPNGPIFLWAWVKGKFADIDVPNKQLKERLQGIDWVLGSMAVTKDAFIALTANTPSPEAAKQISDLLGGVVALFRLQLVAAAEDVPELKILVELLRGTRVAPNGRLVTATGSVSGAVIEKTLAAKKKK